MATMTLEEWVAILEQEILALKRQLLKAAVAPWWEQVSGVFADTLAFDEAAELGRQYRATQQADESDVRSR